MNTSRDAFEDAFIKNLISVGLGVIITYINGIFVYAFFKTPIFYTDPRYILYIHLVINDIMMLFISVTLQVMSYTVPFVNVTVCCFLLLVASTTSDNTALNLAAMALERYIAICKPLHHPQICTVKRTYICIGLIWLLSFVSVATDIIITLLNQPISFFLTATMCYSKNLFGSNEHLIKTIFIQALYLSSVWMTLIFTYFNVLQAANAATTDQVMARKARNTILLHGIQLLLCMLAYVTPLINYYFLALFPKYRSTFMFITYLLSNIFPRLLSPLIYGVRDQKMFKYVSTYLGFGQFSTQVRPVGKEPNS
ncbi:odorant receptor 131-2-like [Pangasianodon hypophthalmus]|uniref:odorant receptor 131-2-like n=1 Tax=Pangasianodon hypophthalmus TaxID=310915 RepID=UPI001480C7BC|nr:odorant receptor 131-2-like [Pangasianodon hypophthalmus]